MTLWLMEKEILGKMQVSWSKVCDKLHLVHSYQLHLNTYSTKHTHVEKSQQMQKSTKKCLSRNAQVPTSEILKFCYSCLTLSQPNLQTIRTAASFEFKQQFSLPPRAVPVQHSHCPLCKERLPKLKPRTTSFTQTAPEATLLQRPEEWTYSNLGIN